jgi:hypothetical protein
LSSQWYNEARQKGDPIVISCPTLDKTPRMPKCSHARRRLSVAELVRVSSFEQNAVARVDDRGLGRGESDALFPVPDSSAAGVEMT